MVTIAFGVLFGIILATLFYVCMFMLYMDYVLRIIRVHPAGVS